MRNLNYRKIDVKKRKNTCVIKGVCKRKKKQELSQSKAWGPWHFVTGQASWITDITSLVHAYEVSCRWREGERVKRWVQDGRKELMEWWKEDLMEEEGARLWRSITYEQESVTLGKRRHVFFFSFDGYFAKFTIDNDCPPRGRTMDSPWLRDFECQCANLDEFANSISIKF